MNYSHTIRNSTFDIFYIWHIYSNLLNVMVPNPNSLFFLDLTYLLTYNLASLSGPNSTRARTQLANYLRRAHGGN